MIEKMKFLSITGHKGDIDRVVDQYLSKYEIHLENALSELKTVPNLRTFNENNPYKGELLKSEKLLADYLSGQIEKKTLMAENDHYQGLTVEKAAQLVTNLDEELSELCLEKADLEKALDILEQLDNETGTSLDHSIDRICVLCVYQCDQQQCGDACCGAFDRRRC